MTERRAFSGRERAALWVAAGGKCAICSAELSRGWHADHVVPWSRGGETDVMNGQALCPACNMAKGNRMTGFTLWPKGIEPRGWQETALKQAINAYRDGASDFLCVATPGAGKTTFALAVARLLIQTGRARCLIVVCPTKHIKRQWEEQAQRFGIPIDGNFENGASVWTSDFHGVAVTYQQVASAPFLHRTLARRDAFVILDEIHHAADTTTWGSALREAFDGAQHRLALSGTPFRSDDGRIPFITYEIDEKGGRRSRPDYLYGYGQALLDEFVVREVWFPSYDAKVDWECDGKIYGRTISEDVPESERSGRLAAALDPNGQFIRETVIHANTQLARMRDAGHHDAAGLVICTDQSDAYAVARVLEEVTGEKPTVAVSDDPFASQLISSFASSNDRWIVAVRMVSEGVDIPRLRLCVYATNVSTELYFRQCVGRIVRYRHVEGLDEQPAYFYMPAIPELLEYAKAIKAERDHYIESREIACMGEWPDADGSDARDIVWPPPARTVVPLGSSDITLWGVVHQAGDVVGSDLAHVQRLAQAVGMPSDPAMLTRLHAALMADRASRMSADSTNTPVPPSVTASPTTTVASSVQRQRMLLRHAIKARINDLASTRRIDHADLWRALMRTDGQRQETASIAHLQARLRLVQEWSNERK